MLSMANEETLWEADHSVLIKQEAFQYLFPKFFFAVHPRTLAFPNYRHLWLRREDKDASQMFKKEKKT